MPAAIKPRKSWFWPENKNIRVKKFSFVVLIYIPVYVFICVFVCEVCVCIYIPTYMNIYIIYMYIKSSSLPLLHLPSGLGDPAA